MYLVDVIYINNMNRNIKLKDVVRYYIINFPHFYKGKFDVYKELFGGYYEWFNGSLFIEDFYLDTNVIDKKKIILNEALVYFSNSYFIEKYSKYSNNLSDLEFSGNKNISFSDKDYNKIISKLKKYNDLYGILNTLDLDTFIVPKNLTYDKSLFRNVTSLPVYIKSDWYDGVKEWCEFLKSNVYKFNLDDRKIIQNLKY